MNWNLIAFSFHSSWLVCYLECNALHVQRRFWTMTIWLEYIFHWYEERRAFLFSVKFDCFTVSLTLPGTERKKKWWKKYKLPVLCVRSYTYLFFPLHIHTDCSLHLRRRVQKVTFEAKKRNKFLSQLFGDFLRIRPYTSLRLYIL